MRCDDCYVYVCSFLGLFLRARLNLAARATHEKKIQSLVMIIVNSEKKELTDGILARLYKCFVYWLNDNTTQCKNVRIQKKIIHFFPFYIF